MLDGVDQLVLGSVEDPDWLIEVPVLADGTISKVAKDEYGVQHGRLERSDNNDLWESWQSGEAPRRGILGRTTHVRVRWIGLRKRNGVWSAVYRAVHPYPFRIALGWEEDPEEATGTDSRRWAQGIHYAEVSIPNVSFPATTDLFGRIWEIDAARSIVTELEIEPVRPQYHPSR